MAAHAEVRIIRRHAPLVVGCLIAGAVASLVLSARTTRTYQSDAELFVSASRTTNAGGVYDRARWAQERVKSYVPLVTSPSIMSAVAKDLRLSTPPDRLADHVSVSAAPDTVLMRIVATDSSAATARDIANATASEFAKFAVALEGDDAGVPSVELRITKPAETSTSPVRPRTTYNLALGAFLGALLGLGVAALRERWSPTAAPEHSATDPAPPVAEEASWPPPMFVTAPEVRRAAHRPR